MVERRKHSRGTMQLDSFIQSPEGLTGQSPPELIIEDDEPDIEVVDSQYDEEDRIFNEEWPDIDEYVKSGLETKPDEDEKVVQKSAEKTEKHMAAMELAPSKKKSQAFTEHLPIETTEESSPIEEATTTESDEMIRIRILQSLPDPIMLGDGVEISLEEDDICLLYTSPSPRD